MIFITQDGSNFNFLQQGTFFKHESKEFRSITVYKLVAHY